MQAILRIAFSPSETNIAKFLFPSISILQEEKYHESAANVVNLKGDSLGDIKEIVIDPRIGRGAYNVVSFGGFLSMGEKLFSIPFRALELKFHAFGAACI